MTPRRFDPDVVQRRLRHLRRSLDDLRSITPLTVDRLDGDSMVRAAVERLVQVSIDLAVEINAHLAVTLTSEAPPNARASFDAVHQVGVIDAELAMRLAPAAGMRNILVHQYVDIRTDLVVDAATRLPVDLGLYIEQVAAFVLDATSGEER